MEIFDRSINFKEIFAHLSNWNPQTRHQAREQLVSLGRPALPLLLERLSATNTKIRWEAAKALGEIGDPAAAAALVRALQDDDTGVRWAAMSSLIQLGRSSIQPLLVALTHDFHSARLREGAHHVLHVLYDRNRLTLPEAEVYCALEGAAPGIQAAQAANHALILEYLRQ